MNRRRILILLAAAAVLAATALYAGRFHRDTALQGSGTVEARNIRVGSKIGGRIDKVLVREGDSVQPGQVLITFDDKELKASLEQSRANAEKARRGFRPEEIAEARAAAAQAKADYELKRNGYRQEDIASAQAELDRAKADEIARIWISTVTTRSRRKISSQSNSAILPKPTGESLSLSNRARGTSSMNSSAATVRGNRFRRSALPSGAGESGKLERGNRREDVDLAKAAYAYDEARFRERQVTAPSAATVEVLDVRPGDLIAPNTPVATLLEKDQIYVRIYIPETEIGRVKVGQKPKFASILFRTPVSMASSSKSTSRPSSSRAMSKPARSASTRLSA